jgi:hypothetical protein
LPHTFPQALYLQLMKTPAVINAGINDGGAGRHWGISLVNIGNGMRVAGQQVSVVDACRAGSAGDGLDHVTLLCLLWIQELRW